MLIDIMENLYREALRNSKTFEADSTLFQPDWCYKSFELAPVKAIEIKFKEPSESSNIVTDRVKMLDSLHQFGNEEIEKSDKKALLFPGGEVHLKPRTDSTLGSSESALLIGAKELEDLMVSSLGEELTQQRFSNGVSRDTTKVMFISDSFIKGAEDCEDGNIKTLVSCFNPSVSLLFSRMINAMGIKADEFVLNAVTFQKDGSEVDYFEVLKSEILFYKPELIITLGAQATNKLLKLKSRLKDIHGNFHQLGIKDQFETNHQFEVMPLFSPTLLQTAPNMKKTAWKDMQKAMEKLSL
jgi:uracil-DNA glycosylase family 4